MELLALAESVLRFLAIQNNLHGSCQMYALCLFEAETCKKDLTRVGTWME